MTKQHSIAIIYKNKTDDKSSFFISLKIRWDDVHLRSRRDLLSHAMKRTATDHNVAGINTDHRAI